MKARRLTSGDISIFFFFWSRYRQRVLAESAKDVALWRPEERAQRRRSDRRVGRSQFQETTVPVARRKRDRREHQVYHSGRRRDFRHVFTDQRQRPVGNGRVLVVLHRRGRRVYHAVGRRRVHIGRDHRTP